MRRKNTSKAAAMAASANARAAKAVPSNDDENRQSTGKLRFFLIITSISALLYLAPNLHRMMSSDKPSSIFPAPPVSNLSSLADSLFHNFTASFDEFYASSVQPMLDRGMSAFNGTRHETEERSRVGYQLKHGQSRTLEASTAPDAPTTTLRDAESTLVTYNKREGARAKHPVVMVPGFVTSGLELWEGKSCAKKHFRQRLWGSMSMARTFFADRECWREHVSLNPKTGMDPENVRLRSAQGFEAADSFIATYWVWSKMIENLADVGYDGSMMTMMSYDWRLGFDFMEKRDGYFTKLKHIVEAHHSVTGEKVVIVSHSMGGTVVYYFLQWVITDKKYGGGGGGKNWVEKYVHSFVNIAGTLLGVPKSIPALLSGELKDIAVLFAQLGELLEQYFGRRKRKNLWNTWGSLFGMLPKGGDAIWGVGADIVSGIDESENSTEYTYSLSSTDGRFTPEIIWNNGTDDFCPVSTPPVDNATPVDENYTKEEGFIHSNLRIPPSRKWSMSETIDYIFQNGGGYGPTISSSSIFSFNSKDGFKKRTPAKEMKKHWHDPTAVPLPRAPSMKIYCLYGTGIPTERAYYYKVACDKLDDVLSTKGNQTCGENEQTCESETTMINEEPPESPFYIDTKITDLSQNIHYGVRFSDGDTSVPLLSLGYMCQKWAEPKSRHNPSGMKVFTRERKHEAEPSLTDPGRGGPHSGEHVDILGNVGVIEDVVRIATGYEVEEKVDHDIIVSQLKNIMKSIDSHPFGGLKNVVK
mmetsp:Transcript_26052/g.53809  ORF Transcript_26052/g.53809 Transcript_26052/m.53809 type:complete len:755 (+) Transcript_26052:198-2462(+)